MWLAILLAVNASAATNYVWQGSPNPTPPYNSWDTAAHVIQDAVDAASEGDTVLVTNGVYDTGGKTFAVEYRVVVDKPLRLVSANGAEATIIHGGEFPRVRCVYLASGARLSGFTVTNGLAGVTCASTNSLIDNCLIVGSSGGGAIRGTLRDCTLRGNSATDGGGAQWSALIHCEIRGNRAVWRGGGAFQCTLENCNLAANSSGEGGAAYAGTLNNCAITGNSASRGGGASESVLKHCTLTGNSATSDGGGAYDCELSNCILYFNKLREAASSAPQNPNHSQGTLNYCCTTPLPEDGIGNISVDPQLASESHLSSGSPCTGAGSLAFSTGTDIDGEPWANPPSIGCDEFIAGAATGPLKVDMVASYTNVTAGFQVQLAGLVEGRTTRSTWDFGDGTVVTNQPYSGRTWTTAGDHSVVFRAFNDSYPAGISATVMVHVVAQPVHYVAPDSANPSSPYTSWATAATNIQQAIDSATTPGAMVLVTNGVYRTGSRSIGTGFPSYRGLNRVAVDKPIHLLSVNGPEFTFIEGQQETSTSTGYGSRIRCAYLTNGASLSGFTLTNGGANFGNSGGGGVFCESSDAVVSNCTLIGNSSKMFGGGAYGGTLRHCTLTRNTVFTSEPYQPFQNVYLRGGGGACRSTLNDCTLTENSVIWDQGLRAALGGGGVYESAVNNCTLRENVAGNGGGAYESVLNNCVLTGNRAKGGGWGGGGAYRCTLNNCTVVGNHTDASGGGAWLGALNNCIVYFNTADREDNLAGGTLNNTCTTLIWSSGVGNITNAPLFVDTNNWADLRLRPDSPCIDAGNNDLVTSLTDLDGNPRIINGIVDMGAYEFVPLTPAERLEQLIAQVNASDLQHKQPLLATLNAALASIERGNHNSATGQLGAFQNKVRAQVTDPVLAMKLMDAAGELIAALDEGSSGQLAGRIHSLKRRPNGKMRMEIKGEAGKAYILEGSTNLVDWKPICVVHPDEDGNCCYEDALAGKHWCRFYRVVER